MIYMAWVTNFGLYPRDNDVRFTLKKENMQDTGEPTISLPHTFSHLLSYIRLLSKHERKPGLLSPNTMTHTYRLVSFQKDLNLNPSNSNTTLRHSNTRSTPLKLIYIFQVFINQKSSVLNTFAHPLSRRKADGLNSELVSLTV